MTHAYTSLIYSVDRGKSWSDPVRIKDCGASECGYPTLLQISPDELLVIYYEQGSRLVAVLYDVSAQF